MTLGSAEAITLIAVATAALLWALRALGQSPIIAYLAIGALAGPTGAGLVTGSTLVDGLGEAGVTLLLFFIGLEFHVADAKRALRLATLGTALQVAGVTLAVVMLAPLVGITGVSAWLAGFTFALSSTAIVMKAFGDAREEDSLTARTSVTILVGQDIIALLAMAALPLFVGSDGPMAALSRKWPLLLLPFLFVAARRGLPSVFEKLAVARHREAFTIFSIAAVLLVAEAAHLCGAGGPLGAFIGGLVLAGSVLAPQIKAELVTVKDLALALFFISIGLTIDLNHVGHELPILVLALIVLTLIKSLVTSFTLVPFGIPLSSALGAGVALSQVGEFAFVLMRDGAPLMTPAARQFVLSLTALSMVPAPSLIALARPIGRRLAQWIGRKNESGPARRQLHDDVAARAVVVGYGPVGITLCRLLIKCGMRPTVIDYNLDTVRRLKAIGREAVYGDASRSEVLLAAGVQDAEYLLVTLPDLASRLPVIASALRLAPHLKVFTRARYLDEAQPLAAIGAKDIVYEEAEIAAELTRRLLSELGTSTDNIEIELQKIRRDIGRRSGFTRVIPGTALSPGSTGEHPMP